MVTLPERQFFVNRLIWYAIITTAALDAGWLLGSGMRLDILGAMVVLPVLLACFAISAFYRFVRRDDNLFMLGHITSQLICAATVLGILSYLSAGYAFPLLDEKLIAIDHALFFDWKNYVYWVDKHQWIALMLHYSYISSGPQIIGFMFLLFLYKQTAHAQRFIITFLAGGLITIVLSTIFPAVAGYVHYNFDLSTLKNIHPVAARVHEQPYMDMRNHVTTVIAFPLRGLVTFPSFHSTLAILMMYCSLSIRWLKWIAIPLNILVLLSTPTDGGHYLIDILGGILVAIPAIFIAEKILPRTAAKR